MKDWQGNEIVVGDTVVVYKFKDMFSGCPIVMMVEDKDGNIHNLGASKPKHHYCWDKLHEFLITEGTGFAFNTMETDEQPNQVDINATSMFIPHQPWLAVCIKGVSDNKEKFMEHYFETT